jgi:hypothetical protein
LVRAPDDPSWNADQLAAVHAVDAYIELIGEFDSDPSSADITRLLDVATDPQRTDDIASIAYLVRIGRHFEFSGETYIIPVARLVNKEKTVNGVRQIQVAECNADNPTGVVVDPDGTRPPSGVSRVQYLYTVQWVEEAAGWRVAQRGNIGGGEPLPC